MRVVYLCMYVCMCMCIFVCADVCLCAYLYVCMIYVHTYQANLYYMEARNLRVWRVAIFGCPLAGCDCLVVGIELIGLNTLTT